MVRDKKTELRRFIEEQEVHFPTRWDNTKLQSARDCPRFCFFRHFLGLTRQSGTSLPAAFGVALHMGIQSLWEGKSVEEATHLAYEEFNKSGLLFSTKEPYTAERIPLVLMQWRDMYSSHQLTMLKPEVGFIFPLSDEWDYYGRIDGIFQEDESGTEGIYELKTTKSKWWIKPNPHNQLDGYLVALSQYQGRYVQNAIVDIIELQVRQTNFYRRETWRSEERLQLWHRETLWLIQYLKNCYDYGVFPANTGHCSSWGGCQFQDLCTLQSPRQWIKLMPTYDVNHWEPWVADEEDSGISLNEMGE